MDLKDDDVQLLGSNNDLNDNASYNELQDIFEDLHALYEKFLFLKTKLKPFSYDIEKIDKEKNFFLQRLGFHGKLSSALVTFKIKKISKKESL